MPIAGPIDFQGAFLAGGIPTQKVLLWAPMAPNPNSNPIGHLWPEIGLAYRCLVRISILFLAMYIAEQRNAWACDQVPGALLRGAPWARNCFGLTV